MNTKVVAGISIIVALSVSAALCFICMRRPKVMEMAALKEPLRSSPLTSEQSRMIEIEVLQVKERLAIASSQREYDELIPLLLERATKLWGGYVPYEWLPASRRELARRPILKILGGKSPYPLAGAAYLAGVFDIQEATPLLIDLLTTRYAGATFPDYERQSIITRSFRALARYAYHGNKQAASFLISHSRLDSWRDIRYEISFDTHSLGRTGSADYVWSRLCDALLYYPSDDSIKALQESRCDYAERRVYNIQAFLASGDTYDEYWKEMGSKGTVDNKYMVNAPFGNKTTGLLERTSMPTNTVGRVRTIRLPGGTNSVSPNQSQAPK